MAEDIYQYDRKIKSEINLLEKSKISERNKDLILKFRDHGYSIGLSKARILKWLNKMRLISIRLNRDFDKATKEDIKKLVAEINQGNISNWTKADYRILIKRFYKWLKGNEEEYPDEVKWIKTTTKNGKRLPDEILNESDISLMIENAKNIRDKALISVLFDSGMRIGELANLRIKHVVFKEEFAEIIAPEGKTGARRVLLIPSVPYLANWIDNHPLKKPDSPLWVGLGNKNHLEKMSYSALSSTIKKTAKRAGLTKKCSLHQFRHASATKCARFMTEAQLTERFGWVPGSRMTGVYVHLAGRDVDKTYKQMYGKKIKDEVEENKITPTKCPICRKINEPTSDFCNQCGKPLTLKVALKLDDKRKESEDIVIRVLNRLKQKQEARKLILEAIEEENLKDKLRILNKN